MQRKCKKCKQMFEQVLCNATGQGGWRCKECTRSENAYYSLLRKDFKLRRLQKRYCQMCDVREGLQSDHDHTKLPPTVWAILCGNCNVAKARCNESGLEMVLRGLRLIELEACPGVGGNIIDLITDLHDLPVD